MEADKGMSVLGKAGNEREGERGRERELDREVVEERESN